jgi:ethanolamine utilization cobalamin adenosyltransferase
MQELIINNYSQEQIFAWYLQIDYGDIVKSIMTGYKICNNRRGDRNPSLLFKYRGQKLLARDYADAKYNGDIFNVVGNILKLDCNNAKQFQQICLKILNDCSRFKKKQQNDNKGINQLECDIKYEKIKKIRKDYEYFKSYGIKEDICEEYVEAVGMYALNNVLSGYRYTISDRCYAYNVNPNRVKLYFPDRPKEGDRPRFITNNKCIIENLDLLKKSEYAIVCKAQKDRLLLLRLLNDLKRNDIQILTFSSEISVLPKNITDILNRYISNLYIMFDYDETGMRAMNELSQNYGYKPLLFSDKAKDPTDFYKNFKYYKSYKQCGDLIKNLKKIN